MKKCRKQYESKKTFKGRLLGLVLGGLSWKAEEKNIVRYDKKLRTSGPRK